MLEAMRAAGNDGERGIAIFLGNVEAPQNYRGNDYKFRQESSFLYFWGIDEPGFAAILDLDGGDEVLYGNDVDIDDIIWMGPQPSVASKGELIGVDRTAPYLGFFEAVRKAKASGRTVHFLPASRYYNTMILSDIMGCPAGNVRITIDRNLRGDLNPYTFLGAEPPSVPMLDGLSVLEIKYDQFLPEIVKMAVQVPGRKTEALSKYAICRQKIE